MGEEVLTYTKQTRALITKAKAKMLSLSHSCGAIVTTMEDMQRDFGFSVQVFAII